MPEILIPIIIGAAIVMKLDVRKFFDHITYPMVKEKVFPSKKYSESNRILLAVLCVYNHAIPQGAPTSPTISNIILRDFDNLFFVYLYVFCWNFLPLSFNVFITTFTLF